MELQDFNEGPDLDLPDVDIFLGPQSVEEITELAHLQLQELLKARTATGVLCEIKDSDTELDYALTERFAELSETQPFVVINDGTFETTCIARTEVFAVFRSANTDIGTVVYSGAVR